MLYIEKILIFGLQWGIFVIHYKYPVAHPRFIFGGRGVTRKGEKFGADIAQFWISI